jgi:hypothetical protein
MASEYVVRAPLNLHTIMRITSEVLTMDASRKQGGTGASADESPAVYYVMHLYLYL